MSTSAHTLTAIDVDSNDKSQKLFQIKREKDDGSGNTVPVSGSKGSHGNRILKGLLNQNDEDESEFNEESCTDNNRPSAASRPLPTVLSQPVTNQSAAAEVGGKNAGNVSCGNANGNNNMLHTLKNEWVCASPTNCSRSCSRTLTKKANRLVPVAVVGTAVAQFLAITYTYSSST